MGDREPDADGASDTVGVTYFRRAPRSAPDGRSRLLHRRSDDPGERLSLPASDPLAAATLDPTRAEHRLGLSSTTSWLSSANRRAGSPDPSLQALPTANVAPTPRARRGAGSMSRRQSRQRAINQPASNPALLHQRTCSLTPRSCPLVENSGPPLIPSYEAGITPAVLRASNSMRPASGTITSGFGSPPAAGRSRT